MAEVWSFEYALSHAALERVSRPADLVVYAMNGLRRIMYPVEEFSTRVSVDGDLTVIRVSFLAGGDLKFLGRQDECQSE